MAVPANEAEFEGAAFAANYRRAQGTKQDGSGRIGGMAIPEKMKLGPGEVICRLGNSGRSEETDRYGAWWVLPSTLRLNAEHASNVVSFVATLRQNLAVPPAFNPMDRLYVATLRQRLSMFAGNGAAVWREDLKPDQQAGAPPLLAGGIERDGSSRGVSLRFQLFIPGLDTYGAAALSYRPIRTVLDWFAQYRLGNASEI